MPKSPSYEIPADTEPSAPATRAVFQWAKQKGHAAWLEAAVKMHRHWDADAQVAEAEFDKAVNEVLSIRIG